MGTVPAQQTFSAPADLRIVASRGLTQVGQSLRYVSRVSQRGAQTEGSAHCGREVGPDHRAALLPARLHYGGRSFKGTMQHLQNAARNVADGHLHQQIHKSKTLPTAQQVNCGHQLDSMLAEIVRIPREKGGTR